MPIAMFSNVTDGEIARAEAVMDKSLEVIPLAENQAKYREEAAEYSLALTRYLDNPTEENLIALAGEQADMLVTIRKSMKSEPRLQELTGRAFKAKIERLYWMTVRREDEQNAANGNS